MLRHVVTSRSLPVAFSKETLIMPRWLLQATMPKSEGLWHEALTMTASKQVAFLERIFHLHGVALRRRTSKSQSCRLAPAAFEKEANAMTALMFVYDAMESATSGGQKLFPAEIMPGVKQRILEGSLDALKLSIFLSISLSRSLSISLSISLGLCLSLSLSVP